MNMKPGTHQMHAFTLIELVLVLVILTALATLALNALEPQVDQVRYETTQRTISHFNEAIINHSKIDSSKILLTGFFIDMGRLPNTRLHNITELTASELWLQDTLPLYAAVQASDANISSTNSSDKEDGDGDSIFADDDVLVRCGWRGPYLQLALGATTLKDGFGHPLTSSTNSADVSHLRTTGDTAITAADTPIYGLRSFGRSNVDNLGNNQSDPYENDIPSAVAGQLLNTSKLQDVVNGTVTYAGTDATADDIVVQVYYPLSNTVMVQQAANEASASGGAEVIETTPADATGFQSFAFEFHDENGDELLFPIGPRVIRAYYKIDTASQRQSVVTPFTHTTPSVPNWLSITL